MGRVRVTHRLPDFIALRPRLLECDQQAHHKSRPEIQSFSRIGEITNQTIYKNSGIAPRIGFSYNLLGDNSTVLKAHYGWYYSSMKGNYFKAIDDKYQPLTYSIWLGPGIGYFDFLTLNLGGSY